VQITVAPEPDTLWLASGALILALASRFVRRRAQRTPLQNRARQPAFRQHFSTSLTTPFTTLFPSQLIETIRQANA
jgi:hypothetical protein